MPILSLLNMCCLNLLWPALSLKILFFSAELISLLRCPGCSFSHLFLYWGALKIISRFVKALEKNISSLFFTMGSSFFISPQLTTMKKEQAEYEHSQNLVRAAREGRLIILAGGATKILGEHKKSTIQNFRNTH